jgi:predicted transcriptional regulator
MISPAQCRAARALLDWPQQKLADVARVSKVTINHFEGGTTTPHNSTLEVIERAFAAAGIEFLYGDAPGLRLHPPPKPKKR